MGRKRHLFLCLIASVLLTLLFINQRKNSVVISKLKVEFNVPTCKSLRINGLSFPYYPFRDFNSLLLKRLGFLLAQNETSDLTSGKRESYCGKNESEQSQPTVFQWFNYSCSSVFCTMWLNLTDNASACYHSFDLFRNDQHAPTAIWYIFQPTKIASRTFSTPEIIDKFKGVKDGLNCIVQVPETDVNSTFLFRFFFRIDSVFPLRLHTFHQGLIIRDQNRGLYPLEHLGLNDGSKQLILSSASRWISVFLTFFATHLNESSQVVAADFFPSSRTSVQLFRIYDDAFSLLPKSFEHLHMHLLLYEIMRSSVRFLFNQTSQLEMDQPFGLITRLLITPTVILAPTFRSRWTQYFISVPYETVSLNLQVFTTSQTADVFLENEQQLSDARNVSFSIGLGWNTFLINAINRNPSIKPVVYQLRIKRLSRLGNSAPFNPNKLFVCALQQECAVKFKEVQECGLQRTLYSNWTEAFSVWKQLPLCEMGDAEGMWMVACADPTCRLEQSCYWEEGRWQPLLCRYASYKTDQLQQCLAQRKLIFVGDSTERGMMEALLERTDGSLLKSDRIKWHEYRRRVSTNGKTTFDFDYYPKFWLPPEQRPSFEYALVNTLRRSGARENDTTLIVGGLDWLSAQHFDTIRRVLHSEGLSRMAVVIKTSGFHSELSPRPGRSVYDVVKSTTHRLGLLAQTARLNYGFRVVDAWSITASRYADFLPGRCQCHFHQVVEVDGSESEGDLGDQTIRSSGRRHRATYRAEGPINQAYTEILADQLCHTHKAPKHLMDCLDKRRAVLDGCCCIHRIISHLEHSTGIPVRNQKMNRTSGGYSLMFLKSNNHFEQ